MKLLLEKSTRYVQVILGTLLLATISCSPAPTTDDNIPPETVTETPPKSITSGKTIYLGYCAPCHGSNGKGNRGFAADFVNDTERMSKSDEELLNSIREGFSGKIGVMPRWKNRLSEEEMVSVLQYIRETFGKSAE